LKSIASICSFALLLGLFLASFSTLPAQAATPTNWYVATTGSDSNDCIAAATACASINAAIAKATASDTILVATGTYTGTGDQVVLIDRDLTLSGGWNAAFSSQEGYTTIDGQAARRGFTLPAPSSASLDHFKVQNGFSRFGAGISTSGNLTITNSLITTNKGEYGGGILNDGNLTIANSTITANESVSAGGGIYSNTGSLQLDKVLISNNNAFTSSGSGGSGGGGISIRDGTSAAITNSTISGNVLNGSFYGAGVYVQGTNLTISNTTVSANKAGDGIYVFLGTLHVDNSTITANSHSAIKTLLGDVFTRNSILAGNGWAGIGWDGDCVVEQGYKGTFTSLGYNLIGNATARCQLTPATGDKVGSSTAPINARLLPLGLYGGSVPSHALMAGSPAINAGSPATPGSGGTACQALDQRGFTRPVGARCDIGAVEGSAAMVSSIKRANPSPTSARLVSYTVTFTEPVTGVDLTDFKLTKTGMTGGSLASISGSGAVYTVNLNLGAASENGTIRLDLVDNDSILDVSGQPLGVTGLGNGNFTGEPYQLTRIATLQAPLGTSFNRTPIYTWLKVPAAIQYQLKVFKGTTLVAQMTILSSACAAGTTCKASPVAALPFGNYTWSVRTMVNSMWMGFSTPKAITLTGPKSGTWKSGGMIFKIPTNRKYINNYTIYINVTGCGIYQVFGPGSLEIKNGKFGFPGSFYANGTIESETTIRGRLGLSQYYIKGCGNVSGGPFNYTATWASPALRSNTDGRHGDVLLITILPEDLETLPGTFIVTPR
jgi:hypothetical protein